MKHINKKHTIAACILAISTANIAQAQTLPDSLSEIPSLKKDTPQEPSPEQKQKSEDMENDAPQFSVTTNRAVEHNQNPDLPTEKKHTFTEWERMNFSYSDSQNEDNAAILSRYKDLKEKTFKGTSANGLLYQHFENKDGSYTLYIPLTPDCTQLNSKPPLKIWTCKASLFVTGWQDAKSLAPSSRWYKKIKTCFTYNGEALPGSKTDPEYNSVYTRFDTTNKILEIRTVIDAKLNRRCSATFPIPQNKEASLDAQTITTIGQ